MTDKTKHNRTTALELRRRGYTYRQIAEALGLSKQRIHQIIGIRPKPELPPLPRLDRVHPEP